VGKLNLPAGMAFDSAGNLFVSNMGNNTITKVATDGTSTVFVSGVVIPIGLAIR
jgi:DNA-binding beta-propeller fold protein YncE